MNRNSPDARGATDRVSHLRSKVTLALCACALLIPAALAATVAAQATQTGAATAPASAPPALTGNAETGKKLFLKDGCYECHGVEGQGANGLGPRLAPDPISLRALTNYIRKPTGAMPPYTAKVVSDQDLADMYAYLRARPRPVSLENIPTFKK